MSEDSTERPDGWAEVSLGQLCSFKAGSAFKRHLQGRTAGDLPFIKVSDMNLRANYKRIVESTNWISTEDVRELSASPSPAGAVVFAKIGEALKSNRFRVLTRPTVIDNNMMAAEARSQVDQDFLYHLLLTAGLPSLSEGSALPYLRASDLARHLVVVPPLCEQRAIAEVLGALDDKIEANGRTLRRCEDVAQLLPALYTPSTTVAAVAEIRRKLISPSSFAEREVDHFSLPAFDNGALPVTEAGASVKSGKFILDQPAVLISKLNPRIPRVWLGVPNADRLAITSTEFVMLVPKGDVRTEVLWSMCASPSFCAGLVEMAKGTTGSHQRVAAEDVLNVAVPDPASFSDVTTDVIVASVRLARALKQESSNLEAVRDALLPKLLSGELRVRDAELAVSEAV